MIDNIQILNENEYRLGEMINIKYESLKKQFIDNKLYETYPKNSIGYLFILSVKDKPKIELIEKIHILYSIVQNKFKTI